MSEFQESNDFIANDLSFLEDIDIDGIVEYLSETDNAVHTKRKQSSIILQSGSQNKKIKVSPFESKREFEQIVNTEDFPVKTQLTKVDIAINIVSADSKTKENKQIFFNMAVPHDFNSKLNNNSNTFSPKLRDKLVLENNIESSQNTEKLYFSLSASGANTKNYTKIKDITSIKQPLLSEPENIEDILEKPKDTNTIENIKADSNIISTDEICNVSTCNDEIYESNTKQNRIEEIKIDAPKNLKVAREKESKIISNESKQITKDKNDKRRSKDKESLKENNLDISKVTKLSSAISIVIRKDDLCLADKLQKRLYQFLKVDFSDVNIFYYGRYSKIFECHNKGKKYALKVINPDLNIKTFGKEKGKMLNKLQQSILRDELNIVFLFASFQFDMTWCLMFDFYPKNLREELETNGPIHISIVENLARQLITVLQRLKFHHIIHSDIKPEHILLNDSTTILKLCGFDRAYHMDQATIMPNIGTPSYRAPEVILGYSASFSIDLWASGIVLYEMMTNKRLFPGCFNNDILFKQMCLLGNMPIDMIENSVYGVKHFIKRKFLKREGFDGKDIRVIYNFFKNNSFKHVPYKIYNKCWKYTTNEDQQEHEIHKITELLGIIDKMLVLHPYDRIPIEILFNDPFMLNSFTNSVS
ncbi:serine/threonine-protein kinase prp4-like [Aricia agestis]|uniref:serine/threonine-protein kinase prp4-like n=1 Tax=Aricia agestis TaxID=91739 RepID=UPI001C20820F|nr:serine/threonine-protein kinase prp4-like [Aricia agestis]